MRVEVQIQGADRIMYLLRSLPYETVSKRGGPVKLALAKGARVLRDQAKTNLQAAIAINGDVSTGLLLENVVATRGKPPTGSRGERYLVRVRKKKYPDRSMTTIPVAYWLEYGTITQPATPWLRPAFHSKAQDVITIINKDLLRRLELIVKKLGR